LADAIGCTHWKIDPKFSNNRAREQNWAELMRGVEKWTQLRTSKECEKILMNANVPSSRFVGVPELVNDPELRANGSFSQVSDGSGSYMVSTPPFKLSNADVEPANWVSDLSQDRKEILHHIAGYSMEEIQQLENDGTVGINSKLSFPP
jgi:formyl-CoA transferase